MRGAITDRQHGRRLLVGLTVIVLLLIIDAVLIVLALRSQYPDAELSAQQRSAPPSPIASDAETAPAVSEPTESTPPATPVAGYLQAVSDSAAWRAVRGDCETDGSVERSIDGGDTWERVELPTGGPVFSLAVGADGETASAVIGGAECEPVVHRTFTAGAEWEESPEQTTGTYITERELTLNGAVVEAPCAEPLQAVGSGGGVVACDDVAFARLSDGSWTPIAQGITAIGPSDAGVAVAMTGVDGCDGLSVGIIEGGVPITECSDVPVDGNVAISAIGSVVWIWFENETRQYSI